MVLINDKQQLITTISFLMIKNIVVRINAFDFGAPGLLPVLGL
jgi:hypothetical protein